MKKTSRMQKPKKKPISEYGFPQCPSTPKPFSTDDAMLVAARHLFKARSVAVQAGWHPDFTDPHRQRVRRQTVLWTRYWHRCFELTPPTSTIVSRCKTHHLNRLEREILMILSLKQLGMLQHKVLVVADVIELLALRDHQMVQAPRALSTEGRLCRAGLIGYEDPDAEIEKLEPLVDPVFLDAVVTRKTRAEWSVSTEAELFDRLRILTRAISSKSKTIEFALMVESGTDRVFKANRKVEKLLAEIDATLERRPNWKLSLLRNEVPDNRKWIICMALLGKELDHTDADNELFTGGGLARAACNKPLETSLMIRMLTSRGDLVQKKLIRPCGGLTEFAFDDSTELEKTEYELGERALKILKLHKSQCLRGTKDFAVREPKISLSRLALSQQVRQALEMALCHARHSRQLMVDWGLNETFSYGTSPVLLFSGPPGVGKTAAAEGLAHKLGKPIMVADYSRIQNCFVGETEKRIAKTFQEASRRDVVLFWDEADAMFYDRDSARQNWEVRHVNVLLQELERFEGVCILATNRKISLDKALERRITVKVEFGRPDRRERKEIWRKMLPKKLPLATDVDLDQLSAADLVGGEIKNVVLNAARLAALRGKGQVAMMDFEEAIRMEKQGQWGSPSRKPIGFAAG